MVSFLLGGGYIDVDSEARAHAIGGQKQSGGLFLGRGPTLNIKLGLEKITSAGHLMVSFFAW